MRPDEIEEARAAVKAGDVELPEREQLAALPDVVHLSSDQIGVRVGKFLFHTPLVNLTAPLDPTVGDSN